MTTTTKAPAFGFNVFGWSIGDGLAKKLEEAQKDPKTAFNGWSGSLYDFISPYLTTIIAFLSSWMSFFMIILWILIIWHFSYKLIIQPLYCYLWRLIFCLVNSGKRSVNYHQVRFGEEMY
jgi:hypothetical protein